MAHSVGNPPLRIRPRGPRDRLSAEADPAYNQLRAGLSPGHVGSVVRIGPWGVEKALFPLIVGRLIYRGIRE